MICSNKECAKDFNAKTHNQTNKKIMEKYYEKKAIRSGAKRECKVCKSRLSRYNQSTVCAKCEKNSAIKNRSTILRMLDDIS
jgi:hypothetical protein